MKDIKEIKRPTVNDIREANGMKRIDLGDVILVESYADHMRNLDSKLPERRN
ncbi:hypothetical protein SHANETTE_54 [Bacillus phage Shanette]|uniref:Uncharacterized protein n=1 Tax=Bacillus phage Shanette TaxID=1296656 RepID=S5MB04_9CAUD|nr:hypothetical protein AVV46_gp054 [Bacillus phage Shanette]AGR46954.1 hypothetical protein SHANETTE_54 [Bacillus phage Shanette]